MLKRSFRIVARAFAIPAIAATTFAIGGCQQAPLAKTELQAIQTSGDAYLAYQRGDCQTVYRLTDPERLSAWESTELRDSLILVNAFCREIDGQPNQALATYRQLVEEAPSSFAADDAEERILLLEKIDRDPEYARWIEEVSSGASSSDGSRVPVSRIPAEFPPAARAAGIEGFAVVEFGVTSEGETREPVVVASSPPLIFDGTSIRAVRQWQFMRDPEADDTHRQAIRILYRSEPELESEAAEQLVE